MPNRLTKIYTRKGDEGFTHLGEQRLSKDDDLIVAIGALDELNSAIGVVLSLNLKNTKIEQQLTQIQNDLFDFGGELFLPQHPVISAKHVTRLETELDEWNAELPMLKEFLLPRGNPPSAHLHLARTICRRAECDLVRLHRHKSLSNSELLRYLNRLSDVLFVMSRIVALDTHEKELLWEHERQKK